MYLTYNEETGKIIRLDTMEIVPAQGETVTADIEVPDSVLESLDIYRYVNNRFLKDENLEAEQNKNDLRTKRAPLLTAFDIYKSNLIVGAIEATEEEKVAVISWYKKILDLDEEAIENPPDLVKQYVSEV